MKTSLNIRGSTPDVRHATRDTRSLQTPNSSFLIPNSRRAAAQRGATLIVTLGILTVLSILAVTFLITTRIQRQAAVSQQHRFTARNHIDEGLHLAIKMVEESLTYPNYTGKDIDVTDTANLTKQRLAPVGHWFAEDYAKNAGLSEDVAFQATDVLASPAGSNGPTVNLLSPKALSLIPSAITNGLQLSSGHTPVFRSGWHDLTLDASVTSQLHSPPVRVAFVVFNCSGFFDANYFLSGPTTQKLPRVCFSQTDVTNWLDFAESTDRVSANPFLQSLFANLKSQISNQQSPFSTLSYDSDPEADPFTPSSTDANPLLGLAPFAHSRLRKFDINSVINLIGTASSESGDWLTSATLMSDWLRPVFSALSRANANEPNSNPDKLTTLQSVSVPWNLINFIDEDRVPQLSPFANLPENIERIATRANFAIEDVPLINKVTVFNIFRDENGNEPPIGYGPDYYDVDSNLSNHYAVAVELWYPFTPAPLPPQTALYAVLSTNAVDTATTTNRPLSSAEMRDWFLWNEAATSNTVMQTLFYAWANNYTNAVGPTIWQHPLWQTITDQSDLWFTPAMTNHPSWPVADTNGVVSITNTPIWNAFYPDTYEIVTTNEIVTATNTVTMVTTNVYTYMTVTNDYVYWVSEPNMTTNRFVGQLGVTDPEPYPVFLWSDPEETLFTTNFCLGFIDVSGNTNLFFTGDQTNHLQHLYATPPESINVVSSNDLTGVVSTTSAVALILVPWPPDTPFAFTVQTNLYVDTEILPVEPLPMPPDLGATLNVLFAILLTPDISLDTSEELYDFLMLLPSEFNLWDLLDGYLAEFPFVQQILMPSVSAPRVDNLFPEDRIDLTDGATPLPAFLGTDHDDKKVAIQIPEELSPPNEHSFGIYITVYPGKTVSFPEVTIPMMEDGVTPDSDAVAVTNYYALGSKKEYILHFRPVVTLDDREGTSLTARPTADNILVDVLDEALLVRDNGGNVFPFHTVTNICVADPRHNGYIQCWRGFPNANYPDDPPTWDLAIGTTNLSTEVNEYPFIHFNTPLNAIGDIGHIYTSPDRFNLFGFSDTDAAVFSETASLHDTISFASRSGAALLDLFTVHAAPSNLPPWQAGIPWRGLVQANTQHSSVIETLFSFGSLGWTNALDDTFLLQLSDVSDLSDLSDAYRDALTNTPPAGIGWRSFADMLPAISTNRVLQTTFTQPFDDAPVHDWIEDALRHLPDRVSFRQNIFVVIIAAQALSPASTPSRPVVLSDQRAAVIVIRDAFTGRWTIYSWRWLTE